MESLKDKYPCIKCNKELYLKIRKYLLSWGFIEYDINYDFERFPYLVINTWNKFGNLSNLCIYKNFDNRYLEDDVISFLNTIYNMNRIKFNFELVPPKNINEL